MTPKVLCLEFELEQLHAVREFSAMTIKALKPEIVPSNGGKQDKRIFQNHILKACVTMGSFSNKFPNMERLELIPKVHFMLFYVCFWYIFASVSTLVNFSQFIS